jgi:hypothetical protein
MSEKYLVPCIRPLNPPNLGDFEPTFRCLESVEIIRNLAQGGDSNGDKPC